MVKHYLRSFYTNYRQQGVLFTIKLLFGTIFYLLRTALAEKGLPIMKFKNRHIGKRCFIIGNGPSLNKIDLTKLKDEYTFGVNAIYTNYEKMGFYPTYYVVEDKFVAEDRKKEINDYKQSTKFFGRYLTYCLHRDEKSILTNVVFDYSSYSNFPKFSRDSSKKMFVGGTVSYLCMQLAYFMGFSEVYLIGFDHSYSIPKTVKIEGNDLLSTEDDVNHFSKEYFGKGKRWHDPMVERMELSYGKANKEFQKRKAKIMNATKGGNLEVFERVEYDKLF